MLEESPLDAIIVGAGFSGLYMLNSLRTNGFRVKLFESGGDLGGTWYWNNYPGARTDSDFSFYQFSNPEFVNGFNFSERFPCRDEMFKYFKAMDEKFHFKKDIVFSNTVTQAEFNDNLNLWKVTSTNFPTAFCRHVILCTGFASKPFTPDFKGLDKFKGNFYHSARWPMDKAVDCKGKRIAIIGTGASGVQLVQELAPLASYLTVYQRTPNLALPMRQCPLPHSDYPSKHEMEEVFAKCRNSFGGMTYTCLDKNTLEATPSEHESHYENLWTNGGFGFWIGNFRDLFNNQEANDAAYDFWAKKVRQRIVDETKRDILAPIAAPHAFGTKRPSLEQSYYEAFNSESIEIIDINQSPIIEITETGIKTEKEGTILADIIIFATGFDSVGGIVQIDVRNTGGETIKDIWKDGTITHLGVSIPGIPNLFYVYGPHSPSAVANGPTCAEVQGEWLTRMLINLRTKGANRIEAKKEAGINWRKKVKEIWESSLFPNTKSWYQGYNIPGKRVEPLYYAGGIPKYIEELKTSEDNDYDDFNII